MECCSQPLIGTNADVSARPELTRSSDPFNTFIIDTGHQRFCHDPYSQSWFLKMNVDVFFPMKPSKYVVGQGFSPHH